jgi:hypothetical protein
MGSAEKTQAPWKEKISHELIEYAINVIYLTLVFAAFTIYKRLVLSAHGIVYTDYAVALIEGLIPGKVIMSGSILKLGRRLEGASTTTPLRAPWTSSSGRTRPASRRSCG